MLYILICFSFLTSFYFYFETDSVMRNSRHLSLINSFITSIYGIYNYIEYYKNGLDNYECSSNELSKFMTMFFITYLILDLVIGTIRYRAMVSILTGYIHHLTFIPLLSYIYYKNECNCIGLMMVVEIPTFFLGLKYMYIKYRNTFNIIFGILFLLFRLIFNFKLIIDILLSEKNDKISYIYMLFPMLFLHIYWFKKYIEKNYINIKKD